MFCSACGERIEDGSRFCRHCGAAQSETSAPSPLGQASESRPADHAATAEVLAGSGASVGKVVGWLLAGILLVFVIAGLGGKATSPTATATPDAAAVDKLAEPGAPPTSVPMAEPTPAPPANWTYSTDEDKVRGSTTYFARTTSTNRIYQDAPYEGGTSMTITVRKHPAWGTDVVLSISEGQMMCPSYEGCSGTVRFDDGPAQRVSFTGPEDNSSETVFVDGARGFIAKLKKAKKVTIEKTLYQAGAPQFEFDVAGLDWRH